MEHLEVPDRPDRPEQPDVVKEKSLQNNVFKNTIHVFCFRYLFFFCTITKKRRLKILINLFIEIQICFEIISILDTAR